MNLLLKHTKIYSLLAFAVLFLINSQSVMAQSADFKQAKRFTKHQMKKKSSDLAVNPHWIEDQDRFWYSYETSDGKNWYMVNALEEDKKELFDKELLASKLAQIFDKPFNSKDLDLKDFEYDTNKELFSFNVDSIKFRYKFKNNELFKGDSLNKEEDDRWATYSPDSTWIAYAKNHNLYLMKKDDPDSTEYQLTELGERWYSFQADAGDTTSNEKLRSRAEWFEDSNKLYAKRTDSRKVKDLWVIHSLKDRPELETYKYPMPGDKFIPQDEIWTFRADTLSQTDGVKLKTDNEKWQDEALGGAFFNNGGIYAGTDSEHLYILRRNRQWNKIDVLKANTSTGESEVLFSEESNPYFNVMLANLAVINEGEEFIWWSERNGWGQYYLYDNNGNLKNKITDGFYTAGDIAKVDTTDRTLYFNGYGRDDDLNPYYSQLYKVNFDGSDFERLTPENATHQISASEEGNYFVDNFSRVDMPTQSVLRSGDGKIISNLEQTNIQRLKKAGWQAPETFKVKANDDATDLYGVMWKPFNFDSTKTYPIITYVYPGPQVEPFPIDFSLSRETGLAQLGFIVVAMGQRGGSPLRSKYYHNYGYGDLRDYPLVDNKYAIEQLAARHSYIDQDRVGIYGHSGGGFMSTAALLTYPEFYDVAWSESGNHDNNIYNIWWSELHNGVKKKTKKVHSDNEEDDKNEGKKDSTVTYFEAPIESNIALADQLEGHLMLTTGTADNNVNPANTIRMANALIKAGKKFEYMILPDKPHGYGDYEPYVVRRRWEYFARYLLDDYRPDKIEYQIPEDDK